jgi:hypothetical protein
VTITARDDTRAVEVTYDPLRAPEKDVLASGREGGRETSAMLAFLGQPPVGKPGLVYLIEL